MFFSKINVISRAAINGLMRSSSSSARYSSSSKPLVVLSEDGSTILCWHPEPSFPYEHTKPLPRREPEIKEGDSELKVQYLLEEKHKYRPDGPTQEELMKIFHTTRHAFDRKPGMRYRKPNPPKDREGI